MNINDWQRAKEERQRKLSAAAPSDAAKTPPSVPARLDILEAELAAVASRPAEDENEGEKPKS